MARGRRPRRRGPRLSPVVTGLLFVVVVSILTYAGFTKGKIPGTHDFRVSAVVENAESIKANSPVRIAGVNVGKVTGVEPYRDTDLSTVKFEVQDKGLPIRRDATIRIRPRTFLEGNFIVEVQPGSPSSPKMGEDQTIPVTQTAGPVRFDEVLTSLQSDTRKDLQVAVDELGTALRSSPRSGSSGPDGGAAKAINRSFDNAPAAFRDGSIVAEALQGRTQGDLGDTIRDTGRLTTSLAGNTADLRALLRRFDTTAGALADEQVSLRRTIRLLPGTLREADGTFDALNDSFPAIRGLSRDLRPGVRELPATIDASRPFIRSTRRLLQPNALRGFVAESRPAVRDAAALTASAKTLLPQVELLTKCLTRTILPAGDQKIEDGPFTSGVENYKEFWYALTGISGEGQNFDGNGNYVRFQVGGGDETIALGGLGTGTTTNLVGNFLRQPQGTRPAMPARTPPIRRDEPCFEQDVPDLNSAKYGVGDGGASAPTPNAARSGKVDADAEREDAGAARRSAADGGTTPPSSATTTSTTATPAPASTPSPAAGETGEASDASRGLTSGDGLAAELGQRLNPFGGDSR